MWEFQLPTPHKSLTHDSGPEAAPTSSSLGLAEVQGTSPTGDSRRGRLPDFHAGSEIPAAQLPADLPATLVSLRCSGVTQIPPLSRMEYLDVPFTWSGASCQPPQGPRLGICEREEEIHRERGWIHREGSDPWEGVKSTRRGSRGADPQKDKSQIHGMVSEPQGEENQIHGDGSDLWEEEPDPQGERSWTDRQTGMISTGIPLAHAPPSPSTNSWHRHDPSISPHATGTEPNQSQL